MDRMFRSVMMLVCVTIVVQCLAGCSATLPQDSSTVPTVQDSAAAEETRQEPAQRFSWTHTGRMRQTAMVGR